MPLLEDQAMRAGGEESLVYRGDRGSHDHSKGPHDAVPEDDVRNRDDIDGGTVELTIQPRRRSRRPREPEEQNTGEGGAGRLSEDEDDQPTNMKPFLDYSGTVS